MYSHRICSLELFIVVKLENKTFIRQMRLLYAHVSAPRAPSAPYSRVVASISVFASIDCICCGIQKNFHGNALMTLLSDVNLAIQSVTAKLYYSCDCTWNTARSTGIWPNGRATMPSLLLVRRWNSQNSMQIQTSFQTRRDVCKARRWITHNTQFSYLTTFYCLFPPK